MKNHPTVIKIATAVASLHSRDFIDTFADAACANEECQHPEDEACPTIEAAVCSECTRIVDEMGLDTERWTTIEPIAWPCATMRALGVTE